MSKESSQAFPIERRWKNFPWARAKIPVARSKNGLAKPRGEARLGAVFTTETAISNMNLGSLLTVKQIVPAMQATERWPAIVELVEHLENQNLVSPHDKFAILDALQQREDQTSTGIGSGVAIPHAFSNQIDDVVAVFGRSEEGIDFEAIDNAPVRFVVLFVVPEAQYQAHLQTLAAIAKMLTNGQIRQRLAHADDAEEILSILRTKPARA